MARKKKDGYMPKSEVLLILQNYIRTIQMNDYGTDSGIPQLYKAMTYIEDAPTADVAEVRHGKWIHKVKRYPYQPDDCEAVCSVCGMDYALDPEYTIKYFAMHNKFCPNCGARMDGDSDD